MTDVPSEEMPNGVLSNADIEKFREHLHSLRFEELKELNWYIYAVIAPTIANNRVVPHDVVFVTVLFILVRAWFNDPQNYVTPRAINYHRDTILLLNVRHYCHNLKRQRYVGEVLGEMFYLLRTTFVGATPPDSSN